MATPTTYIKLDRNIQRWRWYQNANTMRVFLHLLLNANIEDHDFEKITVHRGQIAVSYSRIAEVLELSARQVRTAIEHLVNTGELSIKRYSKFLLITILNYNVYQDNTSIKSQSKVNQMSFGSQSNVNNQRSKEYKNGKNIYGSADGESENGVTETEEEYRARIRRLSQ